MKKAVLFIITVLTINFQLLTFNSFAQAPQKISYQAVIRNANNNLVTNTTIGMRVSLLQGSSIGTAVYIETQTPTSNINGLATIEIGSGTLVSGNFSSINWAAGPYFIKTETDPTGGTTYTITGSKELISVPYALYAANGGITGSTGATGIVGMMGDIGFTGATGAMGSIGSTGGTGSIGSTGVIGLIGITGSTGSGSTGSTGATGDRYATTSSTSMSISPVSTPLTFTVEAGLAYSLGQDVIIAFSSTQQMVGTITGYDSGSGIMNVTVTSTTGSGTSLLPWAINLKGAPGPAGIVGATGNNGIIGSTGATGNNGINGATGSTGSNGTIGTTGATGNNGTNGNTGSVGSVGPTGADATFAVQFNIVNSGSGYLFDNSADYVSGANLNPTITLYRGFTYKFNISTGGSHPFRIASTQGGVQFNVGVSSNDVGQGVITFKVPQNAPSQLFYYCIIHTSMQGTINIL